MLSSAIAINQFQMIGFQKIAADISEESLFEPAAGHQHLPAWILGHLAITGEMGQQLLGGTMQHPQWLRHFAPGSSGQVSPEDSLTKASLVSAVEEAYSGLQTMAANPELAERYSQEHGQDFFAGTPIKTVADLTTLLLTNHFGFHLAQLSSCRREAGFPRLF